MYEYSLQSRLCWPFYFFEISADRALTSVVSCVLFEYLIRFILKEALPFSWFCGAYGRFISIQVPSNLPIWMVVIGALVHWHCQNEFCGLSSNPFNPALMTSVLLISFSSHDYLAVVEPVNQVLDAETGAALAAMKEGSAITVSHLDMFLGKMGGSLGEVSAIALLIGLAYMLIRKIITWHIPVSILLTVAVFSGIMHAVNPEMYISPLTHLLTGGLMLGAIFMATDYVTSPMTPKGMWIYGVGIGILTVVIRTWGSYPEGVSFAILIMNGFTPLINFYIKPRQFGAKQLKNNK